MSPDADAAAAAAGTAGEGRGVIRWDQILPRRSLRVLLVEHDDSTRQVVTALLRKCGYRVAAVADGMKAWGVMRERAYAFDLVLTEVTMPTLSGIELLSRIVASDECKNIPVIMMSSQDSIGTVLRCMQKEIDS
uniref:Response regulatory domain-containing protein n=1 Tax=Oryza meridionalis TaxID=40149 RepID=A0A0E0F2R2_9ORYZ